MPAAYAATKKLPLAILTGLQVTTAKCMTYFKTFHNLTLHFINISQLVNQKRKPSIFYFFLSIVIAGMDRYADD